jgi:hypothetical protein
MNPNREGGQFNFELPPQPQSLEGGEKRQEKGQEAAPPAPERAGQQAPPPALPAIPDDIPAADAPVIALPVQDAATAHPVPDSSAPDSDRIEPAWVNKAKEIIAQTHNDPYLQKDQMSKVKADYIMKRFNKQIKTEGAE